MKNLMEGLINYTSPYGPVARKCLPHVLNVVAHESNQPSHCLPANHAHPTYVNAYGEYV